MKNGHRTLDEINAEMEKEKQEAEAEAKQNELGQERERGNAEMPAQPNKGLHKK